MRHTTALIGTALLGCTFAGAGAFAAGPKSPGEQQLLDAHITTAVKAQIATDRDTQDENIRVTTQNGVVGLHGSVERPAQKQKAEEQARSINGVVDVNNDLVVR